MKSVNTNFANNRRDLIKLSDSELLTKTEVAVKVERSSTTIVIEHLQEIERRKLYLERGFPNLYEMVTKHFGYYTGSAMRRINSMRLVQSLPTVHEKIESGELSLTAAANLQSFFYSEAKDARPYSVQAKIELVNSCLNKSTRDVERELCARNPEREKREFVRPVSDSRVRISFTISDELNEQIDRLRAQLSHAEPSMTLESLMSRLVELGLEKYDPARKQARSETRDQKRYPKVQKAQPLEVDSPPTPEVDGNRATESRSKKQDSGHQQVFSAVNLENQSSADASTLVSAELNTASDKDSGTSVSQLDFAPESTASYRIHLRRRSRYISAAATREAHTNHDGYGCEFVDASTGRRCGSHKFLQRDHIEPFSAGGTNGAENLRHLCGAHNRLVWRKWKSRDQWQWTTTS